MLGARGLVTGPTSDPSLGPSYAYRHALLRDAGYTSLARAERAKLHLRLADWLAGDRGDCGRSDRRGRRPPLRGRARCGAQPCAAVDGRPIGEIRAAAADWFERAAAVASAVAAWETATSLAARAVELTPDDARFERARRLVADGDATAKAAGVDAAVTLLREALAELRELHADGDERVRGTIGAAGWALGNLLRAQTYFDAAFELAEELIAELGEPADAAVGLLIVQRGHGALNGRDDYAAARVDAARALAIAEERGDAELELEAIALRAQVEGEVGNRDRSVDDELRRVANEQGRWDLVTSTLLTDAAYDWDDAPAASLPAIDEAAEVAQVHGLVEQVGWTHYSRAEAHLSGGDWDAAIATGLDAVAFGEARDFYRLVVRSWFALRPIAVARGSVELLEQAYPRFGRDKGWSPIRSTRGSSSPRSISRLPTPASSLRSFRMSSCACRASTWITVVPAGSPPSTRWSDAGSSGRTRRRRGGALADASVARAVAADESGRCDRGSAPAQLLARRGAVADAIAAAESVRGIHAPWWRAKASRLVGELAGDADALGEAERLEQALGLSAIRPRS